uniref:Uncharacterized protein n=1 Tax=Anguilla anguilla TaxID=7936 RepID=A0A0E9XWZ9_ANGAN
MIQCEAGRGETSSICGSAV